MRVYAALMDWQRWLSLLADVLSIVGFAITVFVAWRLVTIRREFLLLGRAPRQAGALRREAKRLLPLWGDVGANRAEIVEVLNDIEVASRSLRATLRGELARDNRQLYVGVRELRGEPRGGVLRAVRRFRPATREVTHEELRRVYNECNRLEKNVREDVENQNWVR